MAQAPTTEQVMKQGGGNQRTGRDTGYPAGQVGQVEPPSGRYRDLRRRQSLPHRGAVKLARAAGQQLGDVCARRWLRRVSRSERVHARPAGRHGRPATRAIFVRQPISSFRGLRRATRAFARAADSATSPSRGRTGLATVLTNVSDVTRQQERIALYTTQLNDGSLFFVVGVAPAREFNAYRQIFNRSVQSLQLNDGNRNSRF